MHFIDSHAHITGETLFPSFAQLVERGANAGVARIVNICTDRLSLERALEVMEPFPSVVHAAAVPPHDVLSVGEDYFAAVKDAANKNLLCAIGETGLDYHYEGFSKDLQHRFLREHLRLANTCDLPLVIHCRDAFDDFFKILDEECLTNGKWRPGVLHCFTGTLDEAKEVIKRGWYISFSGIITFKNSQTLRDVVKEMPLNQILIETDSPWLAPQAYRGQTNEPAYLIEVAKTVAQVKGISLEEVAEQTLKNTQNLFQL